MSPSHINCVVFVLNALNSRIPSVKDLGVLVDTELHFHNRVDRIAAQALNNTLELIRYITSSFRTSESLIILNCAVVRRSEFAFASVACSCITLTDSSKIQRIKKNADLCYNRFFSNTFTDM